MLLGIKGMTKLALDALRVCPWFPETKYARDANLKLDLVLDHLAEKKWKSGGITRRKRV